jgi:hypothetical protein
LGAAHIAIFRRRLSAAWEHRLAHLKESKNASSNIPAWLIFNNNNDDDNSSTIKRVESAVIQQQIFINQ